MKIGIIDLTEAQMRGILNLILEVQPMINNPEATSDPQNRGKIYALATVACKLIPEAFMHIHESSPQVPE